MNVKSINQMNIKFLQKVICFFYYIFLVAVGICLLGFVVVLFIPSDVFLLSGDLLKNGGFTMGDILVYQVKNITVDEVALKGIILSVCISAAIILGILILMLKLVLDIFQTLNEKNPFDEKNSKRILSIGALLIVGSFVFNALIAYVYSLIIDELHISEIHIQYSINDGLLLAGILVMILSSIFHYGTFLQNEYDQTV